MGGFTIHAVAKRSGASKVTIYKLWPSAGPLALEGYFATVEGALEFPDPGEIEADLRARLRSLVLLTTNAAGRTVADLIGRAQTHEHLRFAYLESYSGPRRAVAVQRLEPAVGQRATARRC